MTTMVAGLRVAAVVCGAALVLAGCSSAPASTSATSGGTSAHPAGATTAMAASAAAFPTTVRGDGESAGPPTTQLTADPPAPGITSVTTSPAPANPVTTSPAAAAGDVAAETTWDPCSLPDADIAAAGLNTITLARISDPTNPAHRMCQWYAADGSFELVIGSSERTIDDLLAPGTYKDLRRTEFRGRQVVIYRSVQDTHNLGCMIGTPATFGSIGFTVRNTRVQTDVGDSCADANRLGARLFGSLP
ncbi:DUF3558 family protein [Nocardia spumae]|uniref:DUF3558 family protein n=1 Tax=Nocardia spumae TaxID=2887190 RepID=UPI001D134157|nr:DUF3558 family protein [Nocardia spumae]